MFEGKHICFDLDGTLINRVPLMKDSWENVSTTLNLKIGWDAYKRTSACISRKFARTLD